MITAQYSFLLLLFGVPHTGKQKPHVAQSTTIKIACNGFNGKLVRKVKCGAYLAIENTLLISSSGDDRVPISCCTAIVLWDFGSLTFSKQRKSPGLSALGTNWNERIQFHSHIKRSEPTAFDRELAPCWGLRNMWCSHLFEEAANWSVIINLPVPINVLRINGNYEAWTHFSDLLLTIGNATKCIKKFFFKKSFLSSLCMNMLYSFMSFHQISYRFPPVLTFTALDPLY